MDIHISTCILTDFEFYSPIPGRPYSNDYKWCQRMALFDCAGNRS